MNLRDVNLSALELQWSPGLAVKARNVPELAACQGRKYRFSKRGINASSNNRLHHYLKASPIRLTSFSSPRKLQTPTQACEQERHVCVLPRRHLSCEAAAAAPSADSMAGRPVFNRQQHRCCKSCPKFQEPRKLANSSGRSLKANMFKSPIPALSKIAAYIMKPV